jgi:hypothetical protein
MFTVDRRVWHFTRGENLHSIFAAGRLDCDRNATPAVSVGNPRIKAARAERAVPIAPGGFVSDYVPFYFKPRRPMFVSVVDQSAEGWQARQRKLVYCVTSPARLADAGCTVLYSDRNARLELASFMDDGAVCPIDWQLIDSTNWGWITSQDDWKAFAQAELLARDFVPLEALEVIGVRDAVVQRRVEQIMAEHDVTIPVRVESGWYLS